MKGQKFIPLLVVAAGLLAYHNSFTGAFVSDDAGAIAENPTIRHLWPIWSPLSPPHRGGLTVEGRPFINLSLAINYALGGYDVRGYHALNLTVHILAGLTLLGVVRRTLLQPKLRGRFGAVANELALAIAVLWTVHPLQTESVTYIVQRAESIMGLFYLLTVYCFIRGTESPLVARSTREEPRTCLWYGLCLTACALGMASKEVMVSAPFMVLLYDRAFVSGSFREAWRQRRPLYLGLASTWILLGFVVVSGQLPATLTVARRVDVTWWEYLATEPWVILRYLRLSVWPHPLCACYPWPIAKTWMNILPPTIAVVTLLGLSAWAWRRNSVWGFVGAWFFLILAPSSSFVPLHTPICEHRMYLSLAAVVGLLVTGLYSLTGRHSFAVFVLLAIGLGFLTWRRNQDYRTEVTLLVDTVTEFPNNPAARCNLGLALANQGRIQEAIAQFEQALRLKPDSIEAHNNLGVALKNQGEVSEAIVHLEQALRLKPDYAEAHNNLGVALGQAGRIQEAIAHYEKAVQINPGYAEAHNNLAGAMEQAGKLDEAVRHYEQALRIRPNAADAHNNLGNALFRMGSAAEAIEQWERAERINPDYAEAHYNLGVALVQLGKVPEAIAHWEQALRINPDFTEAHNNLACALLQLDKVPEAIGHFEQALQLKPDYAEAHNNLGSALARLGRVQEAEKHWEQALRINPNYARAHYNLGTALEGARRIPEAVAQYEHALQLEPDFAEAQKALARLQVAP